MVHVLISILISHVCSLITEQRMVGDFHTVRETSFEHTQKKCSIVSHKIKIYLIPASQGKNASTF